MVVIGCVATILVVAIVTPAVLYYKLKIRGLVSNTGVVPLEQGRVEPATALVAPQLGDTEPHTTHEAMRSSNAASPQPAAGRIVPKDV